MCSILLTLAAFLASGCADDAAPPATSPPSKTPSAWHSGNGSALVGVDDEAHQAELAAAIAQARATAEQARKDFLTATPTEKTRWWVKWGATTVNEEVEHVWVQPLNWSPFRIEGLLASSPLAELTCGKSVGELVSFPIEELSDWIHFTGDSPDPTLNDPHEGGFTARVLESHYGTP